MKFFFNKIIKPYISKNKCVDVCEIGASCGNHSDCLIGIDAIRLTIVDPCLDADLGGKYKDNQKVDVWQGLSLNVLRKMSGKFDCILIDGDHNWYTVFNELKSIRERDMLRKGGVIFLHDVCWPYGRRDMYYIPSSIPDEFRHPHAKKGIVRIQPQLSEFSGMNASVDNAIYEGGERNGVLTAIEDFLKVYGREYFFIVLRQQYGLGILIKKKNIGISIQYLKWLLIFKCDLLWSKLRVWLSLLRRWINLHRNSN
ncbi:MAG: class I SAM-dependent methyltransferase [Candidatus Omnitrophota bacterium]|jgi:hypothetical protein